MSSSDEINGHANPHTVKKFDLIEKYVEAWAHILLLNQYCTGLVFIDCMSNSGEYTLTTMASRCSVYQSVW